MKKIILILSFLALPLSSYAQDAIYLSGMLGLTSIDVDGSSLDYDNELSYGLRAGVLFNDHVSAGLFINRYGTDTSSAITTQDFSLTNIMGEVTYYAAPADENSFWVSGLLGITQSKVDTTITFPATASTSQSEADTAYGFSAGYHFMVAPNFSLSPQVTYIITDADAGNFSELSWIVNLTFWM